MNDAYEQFVISKLRRDPPTGLAKVPELSKHLFPHQRDLTVWALRRGRAAVFASTGLGKTNIELEYSRHVADYTGKPVIIFAPLAVAQQTVREGERFGTKVTLCREASDVQPGVNICNYERLGKFDASVFGGVVLDESSSLKSVTSKTRQALTEAYANIPFRLCATATPAPNDHGELGNHAEFLGVCTRMEMLATYFTHDGGNTSQWRLKGHAREAFWKWIATWGALVRHPRDLGYDTAGYDLPPLQIQYHTVAVDQTDAIAGGMLFALPAKTLSEQRSAKRGSLIKRVAAVVDLVRKEPDEPWVIWAELNDEQDALAESLSDCAVSIHGSLKEEEKLRLHAEWFSGEKRVLVSKPSIFGWGMNWAHCSRTAFVGATYSFEGFYQAIRRFHRFGQKRSVQAHVVCGELEIEMLEALKRKERDFEMMGEELGSEVIEAVRSEVRGIERSANEYAPRRIVIPSWVRSEVSL